MALVVADRVQETTATTGTGTITLAGAVSGFQSFATIGNANTTYYCVTSGTAWEVGIGTYTASGTLLARTTILASSAAGAAITLAGTSNVFCVYPAGRAVYEEADGSVILNVNSSTDALRITQTGAGNALVIEDSTNPDSTPVVVDASGRVIIGATTSDATTVTANTAFQISSVNGTNATANFICWSATTSVPPQLQFNKSNSGVIGTRGAVASGDALGFYTFSGDNGTSFVRAAQIGAFVDGAVSAGSMPGRIIFYTSPSGSVSPTERLRIDSAGNVGIGTASPTQKLDVNGTIAATVFSGPHNGTVGATTPSTGAFTTLSASSTVSGTGFSTYLASPPAIGGTAAAAGSFTTLAASSTVSGTGFSTYLASPPAIGGTTASTIRGTTITATTAFSGPLNGTVGATTPSTGEFTSVSIGGAPVAGFSFTSRSTATANAYFVDTDSSATGMNISILKNSASPAVSDDIVNLRFYGNDSTAVQTEYVRLTATIADPTNASEDGTLSLFTIKAGTLAERVRYSSADGLYVVDGAFRAPDVYTSTTGSAANMVMSSASGILQRSTSSLRYKNSVTDATYGLAEVMQLRPVTYKGNNDGDTVFGGFIAEEVHDIGLSQFVQYDDQNRPDALAYGNMVSLLTKAMQEQQAVIEDLKARISVLEAR